MNATTEYFLALFDEFNRPALVPKIQAYLQVAQGRVPSTVWGNNTQYAQALLTAHMLTASGRQGSGSTAGAVTDESVGDLSRASQYIGEPGSGDAALMTTRYGVDFVELRNSTIVPGMVASRSFNASAS